VRVCGGADSWVPQNRRGISADAPCPSFDEQGHRGAEIAVDSAYGKNSYWSELTGKFLALLANSMGHYHCSYVWMLSSDKD
jgi:hypothetical protein